MIPRSLRWRLPLSYAAIALVTSLTLGAVLFMTLRAYYQRQEEVFLQSRLDTVLEAATLIAEIETSPDVLQRYVQSLAVLSQTRVQLFDRNEVLVSDSGDPQAARALAIQTLDVQIEASARETATGQGAEIGDTTLRSTVSVEPGSGESAGTASAQLTREIEIESEAPGGRQRMRISDTRPITDFGLAFGDSGFGLDAAFADGINRSDAILRAPLEDLFGTLHGYVQLSDGPALGRAVLQSVVWGWGVAAGAALAIAAALGWFVSRHVTKPLAGLTDSASRMAAGDLSIRSPLDGSDEFRRLSASFNAMADQVERTVSALRRFVADAAHQINTPLTALSTNLELMSRLAHHVDQQRLVSRVQTDVNRLLRLSAGLLDLSRVESDQEINERISVDLVAIVNHELARYASQAEQAGVSLSLDSDSQTTTVVGRAHQLRQALDNVVDNAIKFTPEGGRVTITIRSDAGSAILCVEDTGIGIPDDDLPFVFDRFHRGRNVEDRPGSGLGLAIARAIVRGHGGEVSALRTGSGTQVCFSLPRAEVTGSSMPARDPS